MPDPAASASASPSAAAVLLETLLSPGAAMRTLASRPRILPAVLVLLLSGLAPVAIAYQRGVIEHQARRRVASDPRMQSLPPEQRQRLVNEAARLGPYSIAAGAIATPLAGLLAASAAFYGLLLAAGARHGFRAVAAVTAHAWLPLAVYNVASVAVLLLQAPAEIDLDNALPLSNPAFLMPLEDSPLLHRIATSCDVFSFWTLALLALGLGRLAHRSPVRMLPVVLGPWLLYVAIFKAWLG